MLVILGISKNYLSITAEVLTHKICQWHIELSNHSSVFCHFCAMNGFLQQLLMFKEQFDTFGKYTYLLSCRVMRRLISHVCGLQVINLAEHKDWKKRGRTADMARSRGNKSVCRRH